MDRSRIYAAFQRRRYRWLHARSSTINLPHGVASFTFDDFPASAADTAAHMLEVAGYRGTFYLATGMMDGDSPMGRICSRAEVTRLHEAGHEIAGHTHSHIDCTRATKAKLVEEYERSQRELIQFGGGRNFAFPFGTFNEEVLITFGARYDTLRTVDPGVNAGKVDLNLLRACSIGRSLEQKTLEGFVQEARIKNGWLILYTHDVRESPSNFGCTPSQFREVLTNVQQAGLAVLPVGEVYDLLSASPSERAGAGK